MLRREVTSFFVLIAFWVGSTSASESSTPTSVVKERIGVYDSRAIAVAFAGSAAQKKIMAPLRAAHQKAKQAGDRAEMNRLEDEGKARQKQLHRQAFSTAPVDDLLEVIADVLPEIRRAAGVSALISLWDEKSLSQHGGADKIDLTVVLVNAFQPTDKQRNTIEEIRNQKPLALEAFK